RSENNKISLGKEQTVAEGEYLYFLSNAGKDTIGDELIWNIKIRYKEIKPYSDIEKNIVYKPLEQIIRETILLDTRLKTIYDETFLYEEDGWRKYKYTLKNNWESAAGANYDYIIGYLKDEGLLTFGRIGGEEFKSIERVVKAISDINERKTSYDALLIYYIYDVNSNEYLLNKRNMESYQSSAAGVKEWKQIQDTVSQATGKCTKEEREKLLSYKWDDGEYYEIKKENGKSYIEKKGVPFAIESNGAGSKKKERMVLDNIDGKELSITLDYKNVYIDEEIYSAESSGIAGTLEDKALVSPRKIII
ncbi:MAG: hypothetical protein FWE72_09330, partial [Spirochaetaceae bacterium]|nr:hypothetical protein [Spirochaetaceae bacterium]